jgi:hypothetical protein
MYEVVSSWNWLVIKTPRNPKRTTLEKERASYDLHKSYLWDFVPDTEFIKDWNGFFVEQTEIIWAKAVDLAVEWTKEDVRKLLEAWAKMQRENWVLFDIFGVEGMIILFNYFYSWTPLKKVSDFFLPFNARYLQFAHKLPPEVLKSMNDDTTTPPFTAHNILRWEKWLVHFVDTDYRPLNIRNPLNLAWNWITSKALKDLENKRTIIRI